MASRALAHLALLLSSLSIATVADPNVCRWSQIRAGVIRDALYLDGGSKFDASLQTPDYGSTNGSLYTLNFSSTFDVSKDNLTLSFRSVAEGISEDQVPRFHGGFMFADDYEFYTYGGIVDYTDGSNPPSSYLYGYKVYEKDPTVQHPRLGSDGAGLFLPNGLTRNITDGAGASVPSENMGFYFGGYYSADGDFDNMAMPAPYSTLITIDMSSEGEPNWSNDSLPAEVTARANAGLVWVPVGSRGTLIAIGGVPSPEDVYVGGLNSTQEANNTNDGVRFMEELPVYDVATSSWYVQKISDTTSPAPPLAQFCSVVVSASDATSHEIYIYGGYNGNVGGGTIEEYPSDDVWVLSVPSFTWTKVWSGNSSRGRYGHTCAAPYPDQMLVIGGVGFEAACFEGPLVRIFNLNKLNWSTVYDPSVWEEYTIPAPVAAVIKKTPTVKWSQPEISTLFNTKYAGQLTHWYPYASSTKSSSLNIGAIAGGVAGACILVLLAAIFWYWKKHKKPRNGETEVQAYEEMNRWRGGVKTDPSVTTTDVGDVDPALGGYYKPAEAPGDGEFHRRSMGSSRRPGGFAEAGGGTRRVSSGPTLTSPHSPRSPHSRNSTAINAQEVGGEERYEMEVLQSNRGSGDIGARHRFRDYHLYPLSVSDGEDRSQTSGPSYSGPSHSQSQSSRTGTEVESANRAPPSPYLATRPAGNTRILEDAELPASPIRPNHLQHTRNISSLSSTGFPQVSPPLEPSSTFPHNHHSPSSPQPISPPSNAHPISGTSGEDELDALEAFHTGSPQPFRPAHTRNLSSLSSGIAQLRTPDEENIPEEERIRQSRLLDRLPSPGVGAGRGAGAGPARELEDGARTGRAEHEPLLYSPPPVSDYRVEDDSATATGTATAVPMRPTSRAFVVDNGRDESATGGNPSAGANPGAGGGAGVADLYSPSSYSRGSTLIGGELGSPRSPVSRKPVAGRGLGIERVMSGDGNGSGGGGWAGGKNAI